MLLITHTQRTPKPMCKCGSTEHHRVTFKGCPLNPRRKDKVPQALVINKVELNPSDKHETPAGPAAVSSPVYVSRPPSAFVGRPRGWTAAELPKRKQLLRLFDFECAKAMKLYVVETLSLFLSSSCVFQRAREHGLDRLRQLALQLEFPAVRFSCGLFLNLPVAFCNHCVVVTNEDACFVRGILFLSCLVQVWVMNVTGVIMTVCLLPLTVVHSKVLCQPVAQSKGDQIPHQLPRSRLVCTFFYYYFF